MKTFNLNPVMLLLALTMASFWGGLASQAFANETNSGSINETLLADNNHPPLSDILDEIGLTGGPNAPGNQADPEEPFESVEIEISQTDRNWLHVSVSYDRLPPESENGITISIGASSEIKLNPSGESGLVFDSGPLLLTHDKPRGEAPLEISRNAPDGKPTTYKVIYLSDNDTSLVVNTPYQEVSKEIPPSFIYWKPSQAEIFEIIGLLEKTPPESANVYLKSGENIILIVGKGLVTNEDGPEIISADKHVKYEVIGVCGTHHCDDSIQADADPPSKGSLRALWDLLLAEHAGNFSTDFDGVLARVQMTEGTPPGYKTLAIGKAEGAWLLKKGTAKAEIYFVRERKLDKGDIVADAFINDQLLIEVESPQTPNLSSIDVIVGTNGIMTPLGSGPTLAAVQVKDKPSLYRTNAIHLSQGRISNYGLVNPAASETEALKSISVQKGDVLMAITNSKNFLEPAVTSIPIHLSPADLGSLWKEKLKIAAKIAGEDITDWDDVTMSIADKLSRVIISLGQIRKVEIKVGDHAAMLLLRDTFIEIMEQYRSVLPQVEGDEMLLGFARLIRPFLTDPDFPLSRVKVPIFRDTAGDPVPIPFAEIPMGVFFLDDAVERLKQSIGRLPAGYWIPGGIYGSLFPEDNAGLHWKLIEWKRKFLIGTVDLALKRYKASVDYAIKKARETEDDDLEGLLRLTGFGFGPIVDVLKPRLVKLIEEGSPPRLRWVDEPKARYHVVRISELGLEYSSMNEIAEADTDLWLAVASLLPVTLPANLLGKVVTLAIGAVDFADTAFNKLPAAIRNSNELEFARGASQVLESDRLDMAEAAETSVLMSAVSAAAAAYGLRGDIAEAIETMSLAFARRRGIKLLNILEEGGIDALNNLPESDRVAALVAMGDAQNQRMFDAEGLSDASKRLADMGDRLTDQLRKRAAASGKDVPLMLKFPGSGAPRDPAQVLAAIDGKGEEIATQLTEARKALADAGDDGARRIAKKTIEDLEQRQDILNKMRTRGTDDPASVARISDEDLAFLTSPHTPMTQEQIDSVRKNLLEEYGGWSKITKALQKGEISDLDMHQLVAYRKQEVDRILREAMEEVNPGALKAQAFGSTNLTSDYDLSVSGPNAEKVVEVFNRKFREQFGDISGLESGILFDTNVYTDPVYSLFRGDGELSGLKLTDPQLDEMRQLIYNQMALRKYTDDVQWAAERAAALENAPTEMRPMLEQIMNDADAAHKGAQNALSRRMTELEAEGVSATGKFGNENLTLRATNDIYANTLNDVSLFRNEIDRLQKIGSGNVTEPSAEFLKKFGAGGYSKDLEKLNAARAAGNTAEVERLGNEIKDKWSDRFSKLARDRQGFALYFASEAYQTEGAIAHVVGELQKNKKPITEASLFAERNIDRVGRLSDQQYISSFNENRANMIKEINHLRLSKNPDGGKMASKAAKYFIRQLDAAHEAGINLSRVLAKDAKYAKVVPLTLSADGLRSDPKAVAKMLRNNNVSPEEFVTQVENASSLLSRETTSLSPLKSLGQRFEAFMKKIGR